MVLPSATDIERKPNVVSYHVAERYPATNTIQTLRDGYSRIRCTATDNDPLNPDPGFSYGKWDDYPLKGGGNAKIWLGAWTCDSALLVYSIVAKQEIGSYKENGNSVFMSLQLRTVEI
jgi:hypothetical protein